MAGKFKNPLDMPIRFKVPNWVKQQFFPMMLPESMKPTRDMTDEELTAEARSARVIIRPVGIFDSAIIHFRDMNIQYVRWMSRIGELGWQAYALYYAVAILSPIMAVVMGYLTVAGSADDQTRNIDVGINLWLGPLVFGLGGLLLGPLVGRMMTATRQWSKVYAPAILAEYSWEMCGECGGEGRLPGIELGEGAMDCDECEGTGIEGGLPEVAAAADVEAVVEEDEVEEDEEEDYWDPDEMPVSRDLGDVGWGDDDEEEEEDEEEPEEEEEESEECGACDGEGKVPAPRQCGFCRGEGQLIGDPICGMETFINRLAVLGSQEVGFTAGGDLVLRAPPGVRLTSVTSPAEMYTWHSIHGEFVGDNSREQRLREMEFDATGRLSPMHRIQNDRRNRDKLIGWGLFVAGCAIGITAFVLSQDAATSEEAAWLLSFVV